MGLILIILYMPLPGIPLMICLMDMSIGAEKKFKVHIDYYIYLAGLGSDCFRAKTKLIIEKKKRKKEKLEKKIY
jgi:hypothetical protein